MAPSVDMLRKTGRRIAVIESPSEGPRSTLFESEDGWRYLVWEGASTWRTFVGELFSLRPLPALFDPADQSPDFSAEALVLKCSSPRWEPFDIWTWRNLPVRPCVSALTKLAETVDTLHRAGWTLGGLERSSLLFEKTTRRLAIGAVGQLRPLDDDRETIWRDIRVFAELAYENFLEQEYPGGHQLVTMLQDREAMAQTGITTPGLSQLLAGCVTPYGDLAYEDTTDLLEGLRHLTTELTTTAAFRVGSRSTQGSHIFRQNNQDSCGHVSVETTTDSKNRRLGFYCVADGIGGIEDGQRASELAVEASCAAFLRAWNHCDADAIYGQPVAFARSIAKVTSQRLALEGDFSPDENRGGTTFTGLLLVGDRAGICHVGDSRANLVRGDRLVQLTRDHTLAAILDELGESRTPGSEREEASRRTIARFFSTGAELEYRRIDGISSSGGDELGLTEYQRLVDGFRVRRGDVFVLTSDGAHGAIDPRQLRRLANKHGDSPQELSDAIVEQSLEVVARDNATALAVCVE